MPIGIGISPYFSGQKNRLTAQQIVTRSLAMKTLCIIGDSNTNYAQYRHGLIEALRQVRNDFRLVGTQNRPWETGAGDVPDSQCWPACGYPGEKFTDFQADITARMAALRYPPDVFLVNLGTNDASQYVDKSNPVVAGEEIFERARTFCLTLLGLFPRAKILLTTILRRGYPWNSGDVDPINDIIDYYNNKVLTTPIHNNVVGFNGAGQLRTQDHPYNDSIHSTFEGGMRLGRIFAPAVDALLGARGGIPFPSSIIRRKAVPSLAIVTAATDTAIRTTDVPAFTSSDRFLVRFYMRATSLSSAGALITYSGGGGDYTSGWAIYVLSDGTLRLYKGSGSLFSAIAGTVTANEDCAFYWHHEPGLGTGGAPLSTLWKCSPNGVRMIEQKTTNATYPTTGGVLRVGKSGASLNALPALYNNLGIIKGTKCPHVDDMWGYIMDEWYCGRGLDCDQEYQMTEGTGAACYDTTFTKTAQPSLAITGATWSAAGAVARIWDDNK